MRVALLYDRIATRTASPSEDLRENLRDVRFRLSRKHEVVAVPAARPLWKLAERLRRARASLVFNLCEGLDGDARGEAAVAGLLELLRIPFTGNPSRALSLCQDKGRARQVLRAAGVPVPRGWLANKPFFRGYRRVPFPAIVKPRHEDASLGIDRRSVVRTPRELVKRVATVLQRWGQEALVEEFLDRREFSAALLAGRVLGVSEIRFSIRPRLVTYAAKWRPGSADDRGTVPVCPAQVSPALCRRLEATASRAAEALGCSGPVRVDLRGTTVIDVNPNPDLSRTAGFARCARAAGLEYGALLEELIRHANHPAADR